MLRVVRTSSTNPDFQYLVSHLDHELSIMDGDDHPFYAQYNKIDSINYAVVLYLKDQAVGCGAIKEYNSATAEIKRMFVLPASRGQGISKHILSELEAWAAELNFKTCILETGLKQRQALGLYHKTGYQVIPNYGQYIGVENSVCMKKDLVPTTAK